MSRKRKRRRKCQKVSSEAARHLLEHNFTNIEDLQTYLQEMVAEEDRIKEAKKRRPLREGDQLFRRIVVIDGKAFLSSVVIRTDGSMEFWIKRFFIEIEEDEFMSIPTHETFELAAHLQPRQDDERSTP